MKTVNVLTILVAALLLQACQAKLGSEADGLTPFGKKTPYANEPLQGNLLGKGWRSVTAVVRPFSGGTNQLNLYIYGESKSSVCGPDTTSRLPLVSAVIPANYQAREYDLDLTTGTPVVISEGSNNVIADVGRLSITEINEIGFNGFFYTKGYSSDGTISEINGQLKVVDCRKVVDFSVWSTFERSYDLVELDGVAVGPMMAFVRAANNSYYDRASSRYVRAFEFPLFYSVNGSSTASFTFGPMEGLGKTTVNQAGDVKTLTYSYQGPIYYRGTDITLNLDMKVVADTRFTMVSYTLEIPGHIGKSTHTFKLK